jgi:predicted nucleic acid-binding Zn ribbon protein
LDPLGDEVRRELRRFGPNAEIGAAVEAWPAAVGEEIARNAWPARFQRDGTLIVHARDSVWAFELTQRAEQISERLPNTPSLKFVPGHLPARGPEPTQATPQGSPPATVEQIEQAAEWTAAIEHEELRKVVAKAAELSLARPPADHSF